jgi:hypothetical protein
LVRQAHPHQIQHFAEGAVGEAGVGQQADRGAPLLQVGEGIGQVLGGEHK